MGEEERHGVRRRLVEHSGGGEAIYTFFACLLALGMSGLAAYFTKQPLLFPSLGPTALLFIEAPMSPESSPRNTIIGHLVAVLAGAASLAVFGILDHPSVFVEGITPDRVGAAALSLALTGAVLLLLKSSHPPTGATTLIVSLGLLRTPHQMAALMGGVVLMTVVGWSVNRAAGVRMPLWSPRE